MKTKKQPRFLNSKGFFGFAVILAMTLILFQFNADTQKNFFELEQTKNELLKSEQANKERTLLENNVDKIIQTNLYAQALKHNFNLPKATSEINSSLLNYLQGKAEAIDILHQKQGELNLQYLNDNSKAIILPVGETGVYAQYLFASESTTNTVGKKLGNSIQSWFELPLYYTEIVITP